MKNFIFKQFLVWLLILIGLCVFSLFVYIIGSNKGNFFKPIITYRVQLKESNGIYTGTKVSIHGKSTGNVLKTNLLSNGEVEVIFTVRKIHSFVVTESSVVHLKNAGALGDRFIDIFTADLSAPPLKKGSLIPYQDSSSLLSVLTGDGEGAKSIQNILRKLELLLQDVDKKGGSSILLSSSNQKDLNDILKSTKSILNKVDSGQGSLGAIINNRALYNRLLVLLGKRPGNDYLHEMSRRTRKSKK